ncbi:unnamed protein product [Closterium sp. NIES-64]|nr:unnamed protein product [Closterium sp. NIES-64]
MAPRVLCHGCSDEGHAWQRCPYRLKGGIPAFLKRGGCGSNGKAQVADEEEQDDKAEAVVGEAVAAVGEEQPREGWWIDSGASHNFTPYASDFKSKLQPPEVRGVRLGDGRVVKAVGMGEVPVVGAGDQLLRIQKVHLVREMHTRLLSVPHLTSRDVIVTFKGKICVLKRGERVFAIGEKERGRYHGLVRMSLLLARGAQGCALAAGSSSSFSPLTLAHRRLGHTTPTTLQQMARGSNVLGLEIGGGGSTDCSPCEPCLLGKSARKPFPHEASRALGPLDEVHMNLWGPVRTPSLGGAVYVLSLIDDFIRRVWSFPLPNNESATVAKVLRQWHKDVELECGRKLKAIRSDRGGEFLGDAVKASKVEFGIKTQLSVVDTPQQNGVVERWHRTMAEGIRTLLVDYGLPARLWGEALMWVVWAKNRVTHSALPASITPMEAWSGQKPHVGMARIWGCMGSVMLHGHEKGGKLDARAVMCVCVGVDMESKGWRMLDPSLMRIRIARDVDFLENVMWKDWDKAKGFGELLQDAAAISQLLPLPLSPPSATVDDVEMPPSSLPPAPLIVSVQQQPTPLQQLSGPSVIQQRSATQATSSSSSSGQRSVPLSTGAPPSPATTSPPPVTGLQVLGIQSGTSGEEVGGDVGVVEGMLCLAREVEGVALAGVSTGDVPRTLAEALCGPEGPAWKAGAEKEVNVMRTMGVWDPEPVDLPPGLELIGQVKEVLAQRYQMKDLVLRGTKTHSHACCTESTQATQFSASPPVSSTSSPAGRHSLAHTSLVSLSASSCSWAVSHTGPSHHAILGSPCHQLLVLSADTLALTLTSSFFPSASAAAGAPVHAPSSSFFPTASATSGLHAFTLIFSSFPSASTVAGVHAWIPIFSFFPFASAAAGTHACAPTCSSCSSAPAAAAVSAATNSHTPASSSPFSSPSAIACPHLRGSLLSSVPAPTAQPHGFTATQHRTGIFWLLLPFLLLFFLTCIQPRLPLCPSSQLPPFPSVSAPAAQPQSLTATHHNPSPPFPFSPAARAGDRSWYCRTLSSRCRSFSAALETSGVRTPSLLPRQSSSRLHSLSLSCESHLSLSS